MTMVTVIGDLRTIYSGGKEERGSILTEDDERGELASFPFMLTEKFT